MADQTSARDQSGWQPPVRRRRRWRVALLAVAVSILIGLSAALGLEWYARLVGDREVRAEVSALDQSDPGWRLPDIEAQRPPLPDEQNSGLRVAAAYQLLPPGWPTPPGPVAPAERSVLNLLTEDDLFPEQQLDEEQTRELRAELEKVAGALREAQPLADMPYGRDDFHFDVNFLQTRLDAAQHRRPVAWLLAADAVLRAQEQDADGACRSVRAVVNTGRSLGDQYSFIGSVIRTKVVSVALLNLERVLAQGELGEESLALLQRLLEREEEETPASFRTAICEERALMHRAYEALESGDLDLFQSLESKPPRLPGRTLAYLSGGAIRHSHAVCLQRVTEWADIVRLPPEEQDEALKRSTAKPIDLSRAPLLKMLPAVNRLIETLPRKLAGLRSARVALALEHYRRKHHDWPDSLDVLVREGLLRSIPQDPYTGQPLRSRSLKDGLVVYSVGPDRGDDRGNLDRKHPAVPGTDLGFRLWDPAQRRQSPLPKEPPPAVPPPVADR